jgi:outer membrane protein OmpA-like peptidoglycan-associated protein
MKKLCAFCILLLICFQTFSQNDPTLAEISRFRKILNGYNVPKGTETGNMVILQKRTYDSLVALLASQKLLIDNAASALEKATKRIKEAKKTSVSAAESGVAYFSNGSFALSQEAKASLKEFIRQNGKDNPLAIDGFADFSGSKAANEELSRQRAFAVKQFLTTELKVSASLISVRFFGSEKRVCTTEDPACCQLNRRAEIKIR